MKSTEELNNDWNRKVNELRFNRERRLQEENKGATYQIIDNRSVKSKIIIDRPCGFSIDRALITNMDTKRPIKYTISGMNIILSD